MSRVAPTPTSISPSRYVRSRHLRAFPCHECYFLAADPGNLRCHLAGADASGQRRYSPECVEGFFSEVRRSKQPLRRGGKRPTVALWSPSEIETERVLAIHGYELPEE